MKTHLKALAILLSAVGFSVIMGITIVYLGDNFPKVATYLAGISLVGLLYWLIWTELKDEK